MESSELYKLRDQVIDHDKSITMISKGIDALLLEFGKQREENKDHHSKLVELIGEQTHIIKSITAISDRVRDIEDKQNNQGCQVVQHLDTTVNAKIKEHSEFLEYSRKVINESKTDRAEHSEKIKVINQRINDLETNEKSTRKSLEDSKTKIIFMFIAIILSIAVSYMKGL